LFCHPEPGHCFVTQSLVEGSPVLMNMSFWGRNLKKIAIISAAVLALLVVSIGTSVFLVNYLVEEKINNVVDDGGDESEEVAEVSAPPIYLPLDPFVVNFVQNGALRYLQITLQLMSRSNETIELTKESIPEIRNSLILILSGHEYTELASREGKELIRAQVQEEVNRIIHDEEGIESVFLTGFVMQ
jgi:flagellar protein FliL